jgi:hypothetical protein
MSHRVGVTEWPDGPHGTVFDLPGCGVQAHAMAALRDLLPVAIAEHLAWLARHGETVDANAPVEFEIAEIVDPTLSDAADGEFCFEYDLRTVTGDEVEAGIRHMGYATADLLALVEPLPDAVLDWRPPQSAMAKVDVWQPNVKTIREIARELPASERYYRLGLSDHDAPSEPEEVMLDRVLQRRLTIERLRSLSDEERATMFRVQRAWQDRPEHWTARKTVRRIIGHERFHTKEIEQRLAWLLLGVPAFQRSQTALAESAATRAGR